MMWTDVYKPNSIKEIVGNYGAVTQLYDWLKDWENVHIKGIKKAVPQ